MIEIIPNWHPIFVHFAIALLAIAVLFHLIAMFKSKSTQYYQFEHVANWNLWLGAVFAIVTAVAGIVAYNTVEHDTPSHLAMTVHRNWAMITTGLFVVLAVWSFQRARKAMPISWLITLPLLVAAALLGVTGWKGGELVYRHGLGVMQLPNPGKHDHAGHDHGDHAHSDHEHNDQNHDGHTHEHTGDVPASGNAEVTELEKSEEAAQEVGEQPHSHDGNHDHDHDHDHDHGDHTH